MLPTRCLLASAVSLAMVTTAAPNESNPTRPPALDHARHGHCMEVLPDGTWWIFGGYADGPRAQRGATECYSWAPGANAWRQRADLPHALAFAGSAQSADAPCALGDGAWRYDAAQDAWVEFAPTGTLPRSHFGCATVGSRVIVIGGMPPERGAARSLDLDTGTVTLLPPRPGAQEGDHLAVVATVEDEVHVIGGIGSDILDRHLILRDDTWVDGPRPPAPVWAKFAAIATSGTQLWIFSEEGGLRYDTRTGAWSRHAHFADALGSPMLAMPTAYADAQGLLVLGGRPVDRARPVHLEYDATNDLWTSSIVPSHDRFPELPR